MDVHNRKVSFGFNKVIKKAPTEPEEKKQFIDCIDDKSIHIKDGESTSKEAPLIIPVKPDIRLSVLNSRTEKIHQKNKSGINGSNKQNDDIPQPDEDMKPPENESLDALAAREIMEDIKKKQESLTAQPISSFIIPTAGKLPNIEGEKESTLEDYESIPISNFGMAMLRGMGWTPRRDMEKCKDADLTLPTLRPKGLGLGADKLVLLSKDKQVTSDKDSCKKEELSIVKGSFVKVIAGSQRGTYGQVTSFDEYSNRITLKTAIKGEDINVSEHLLKAVSKDEYGKFSKVINSAKYEEYKMKEKSHRLPGVSNRKYNDGYQKRESEKHSSRGRKEGKKGQGDEESRYSKKRDDERHRKY